MLSAVAGLRAGHVGRRPALFELVGDLESLWKTTGLPLREDELPVDLDVELPRLAHDQLSVDPDDVVDGGRETRSLRLVVSGVAVADDDLHGAHSTIRPAGSPAPDFASAARACESARRAGAP